jgi:hypothetical protein
LAPFSYQWLFNGARIEGASSASLLITNAQLAHDGTYSVVLSNSYGSVPSTGAALVVLIRPVVTVQPVSQSAVAGGSITLSATAVGNPLPLTFRWRLNSASFSNLVVNGTDAFLTVTNLQPTAATNQFYFAVAVTNLAGSSPLSSNAVITVLADTDGDGMPDEWELANSLSPANSADAAVDSDGDGLPNGLEYLAGTNPLDAQSYLKLQSITWAGTPRSALLRFAACPGKTYTVLRRDSADGEAWSPLFDVPAASSNRVVEVRDVTSGAPGQTARFYRLATPRQAP